MAAKHVSFIPRAGGSSHEKSSQTRAIPTHDDFMAALEAANGADMTNLTQHMQDLHMVSVDQWPSDIKQQRRQEGKPTLESNILAPIVHRVINDVVQNQPGVSYVSSSTEVEITRKMNMASAILRGILALPDSKIAVRQAVQNQVICGYGHWGLEIVPDNSMPKTFRMRVRSIPEFDGVIWDPTSRGLTKEDANYCFVRRDVSRQEFIARFPGKNPDNEDTHDIMQRYYRGAGGLQEGRSMPLETTASGSSVVDHIEVSSWNEHYDELIADRVTYFECYERRIVGWHQPKTEMMAGGSKKKGMKTPVYKVFVTLVGAKEKLKELTWPGTVIPVFTCIGSQYTLPRRTVRNGVVSNLADTQRTYNLMQSLLLEHIASQNLATWLVTADTVDAYPEWKDLGRHTGYLRWLPGNDDAKAHPPQRIGGPAISEGLASLAALLVRNADMISGVSEAYKGQKSNETSRAAIVARTSNSALAVDHFPEHLAATLRRFGQAVGELIPKVYSNEQPVLESVVMANGEAPQHVAVEDLSSLADIPLQVELSVNYATRKDQQLEVLEKLLHNVPDLGMHLMPYIIKQMDLDDKDEIVAMLRQQLAMAQQRDPLEDRQTEAQIGESESRSLQNQAQAAAAVLGVGKNNRG